MAMRYPSPVVQLGIPYVIGPIGGGVADLIGFQKEMKAAPWFTKLRKLDSFRLTFDFLLKSTFRNADLVIGTAPHVESLLGKFLRIKKFEVVNENGVERTFNFIKKDNQILKLLFVGRVIRTKGVRDLVRSIQFLPKDINVHLDVVGDGEDMGVCIEEAKKIDSKHVINFHGKLDRNKVDLFYKEADVFVFPSFREPSGGVIIEAMSYGLPQIVAYYGGPASIVTDDTGIRILPKDIDSYPKEIAGAIYKLALDPNLRKKMSDASFAYVEENYIWKNKIRKVHCLLENLEKK